MIQGQGLICMYIPLDFLKTIPKKAQYHPTKAKYGRILPTLVFLCLILLSPLHQESLAGGTEPELEQVSL